MTNREKWLLFPKAVPALEAAFATSQVKVDRLRRISSFSCGLLMRFRGMNDSVANCRATVTTGDLDPVLPRVTVVCVAMCLVGRCVYTAKGGARAGEED